MGSKSKRLHWSGRKARARAAFIKRHESNPANYLPGAVLTRIYAEAKSQAEVERQAAAWVARNEEWFSRRVQCDTAMWRASARWPK